MLRPDPRQDDNLVAVGGVEDDWVLHGNLPGCANTAWNGWASRIGRAACWPAQAACCGTSPNADWFFSSRNSGAPVVIKAAAMPAGAERSPISWSG